VLAPASNSIPGVPNATFVDPDAPLKFTSAGVATQIENLADSMINSVSGTLTRRNKNLNDQIESQNKRIDAMNDRLEARRAVLQAQFLRMEQAIGQLQQQSSSIMQIGG
jgi:flagellar capping protein FliD